MRDVPAARGDGAPLVRALESPAHANVASPEERAALVAWARADAPAFGAGVHAPAFADPYAPESHARWLRARGYRPMLDADDADACGACHDGAPARRAGLTSPAPGATACTACHTESGGALACTTCHGVAGAHAHPPRDRCFHPEAPADTTHAPHVRAGAIASAALPCGACHPTPGDAIVGGLHADGHVQVMLPGEAWDATSRRCTTRCHAGPDAHDPRPVWGDARARACNDCHGAPPAGHYRGACTSCHRDANETGTALRATRLHVNGRVDLGDGSGACGACHGTGDDPWPSTGAHAAHRAPSSAAPVACETCHEMPAGRHPVGDSGRAHVRLAGLATKGGRAPVYDAATGGCASVYCHDAGGGTAPAPRWADRGVATCGACHAAPPPPPHPASGACGVGACHGGLVEGTPPQLTAAGKRVHVDGVIDLAAR